MMDPTSERVIPLSDNEVYQKKNKGKTLQRSGSGIVSKNLENRKAIQKNQEKLTIEAKIQNYDEEIKRRRGSSPEREMVVEVANDLIKKTKDQKNRSNVFQLIRGGSLSYYVQNKKDPNEPQKTPVKFINRTRKPNPLQ